MSNETLLDLAPVILMCAFGLVYCFFGYRFLVTMFGFLGAFLGYCLGVAGAKTIFPHNAIACISLGLIGALIAGAVFAKVYKLAVFCAGFLAGFFYSPFLMHPMDIAQQSNMGRIVAISSGILLGLIAIFIQKEAIIFLSAAIGAVITVVGSLLLINHTFPFDAKQVNSAYTEAMSHLWWVVLVCAVLGMIVQWRQTSPYKGERRKV